MDQLIDGTAIRGLRRLFKEDDIAGAFFNWAANRQNDASQTSIEYLAQKAGADRRRAIGLAKALEDLGCARFVVGRRGGSSRVVWLRSLKSIGKAAAGISGELDTVDPDLAAETAGLKGDEAVRDGDGRGDGGYGKNGDGDGYGRETADLKGDETVTGRRVPLTIAEAKEQLAAALGVSPSAIEITVRA